MFSKSKNIQLYFVYIRKGDEGPEGVKGDPGPEGYQVSNLGLKRH